MKIIDLRSDTVTKPTEEMRKAMYEAEVGDDVYREDPTVLRLEKMAAEITGKEDAIFVSTGTMGNQLAVLCHTQRGDEIIVERKAHVYNYEVGGIAFLSGVQPRIVEGTNGIMSATGIEEVIVNDRDIHHPQTSLICLENTHNMAGGIVVPLEKMEEIYNLSRKYKLPIHLDGARIFNAATVLNCQVKEITKYCDSVMFCLSKGLCAPAGSILAGDKDFIEKARRYRKLLGGGMRQIGIIAAAGIVGLTKMTDRLWEDHENAKFLAQQLENIKEIKVDASTVQTNIVMVDLVDSKYDGTSFTNMLKEKGILVSQISNSRVRLVTHYYFKREDIPFVISKFKEILQ